MQVRCATADSVVHAIIAIRTLSFFLVRLTPGGPEAALMQNPRLSAKTLDRMRERYGLNDPLLSNLEVATEHRRA